MEIITGVERRRRWRLEEKLRIVAAVEQPGACFADVARRHDVSRGLLWIGGGRFGVARSLRKRRPCSRQCRSRPTRRRRSLRW
jgi:Transposase